MSKPKESVTPKTDNEPTPTISPCNVPYRWILHVGRCVNVYFDPHQPAAVWDEHQHPEIQILYFGAGTDCTIHWMQEGKWTNRHVHEPSLWIIGASVAHKLEWRKTALRLVFYRDALKSQPPEQLGGVKTTIANYLKVFTDPDIAAVFCPPKSSFAFDQISQGKVVCVALPQRFQVERRTLNTLLKLAFYSHALRRFDRPAAQRAGDNLLIFWADEAQKIVTASEDGMSDYNVVDVIREARATVVAATQSYTSLIPPMQDERKAKVFIANMANRVTFCAADEDSAKIAADTLGNPLDQACRRPRRLVQMGQARHGAKSPSS